MSIACTECLTLLDGDDILYEIDGESVCENCAEEILREKIEDMTLVELADLLNVNTHYAWET